MSSNRTFETEVEEYISQPGVIIWHEAALQKIKTGKFTSIAGIQGAVHTSPRERQTTVDVFGVVTAVSKNGFFMQSLFPDDRAETSEGLFVFLNAEPGVAPGDWVLVDGKVQEFYPGDVSSGNLTVTELSASGITLVSSGNSLPEPVILGRGGRMPPDKVIDDDRMKRFDLVDGLDFYESLEGMLVQINGAVCVGPSSVHQEFVVVADGGLDASGMNPRGGISIKADDFNPERIIIDDRLFSLPLVNVSDTFEEPIIGVVDYSFGAYKVLPTRPLRVTNNNLPREEAESPPDGFLTIASLNVENLDAGDGQARFNALADIIVKRLKSPDIIALQEIQDDSGSLDDGETSSRKTAARIKQAILDYGGPEYQYADIPPRNNADGGEPGGNIRVAFLYRLDSGLSLLPGAAGGAMDAAEITKSSDMNQLNFNPVRIDPGNFVFNNSRKSLLLGFEFHGQTFYVINNHWISKGEDDPLFGKNQPPKLVSETQRKGQALLLAGFVRLILTSQPDSNVIVLGDLNDFYFSESLKILGENGLVNLLLDLAIAERYTYNYEGNAQNLDNFLVSQNLRQFVNNVDIVHINSEYSYTARFSDHDPIIVSFVVVEK